MAINYSKTEKFSSPEEAEEWFLREVVDDPCVDNNRFAFKDDAEAMAEYEEAVQSGCCGSCDIDVEVAGRLATVGCNYGH
jgi:hypothetical protein